VGPDIGDPGKLGFRCCPFLREILEPEGVVVDEISRPRHVVIPPPVSLVVMLPGRLGDLDLTDSMLPRGIKPSPDWVPSITNEFGLPVPVRQRVEGRIVGAPQSDTAPPTRVLRSISVPVLRAFFFPPLHSRPLKPDLDLVLELVHRFISNRLSA